MKIEDRIDLKLIFTFLISNFYFFIISIIVASSLFFLVNSNEQKHFYISSKIYNFTPKDELLFKEFQEILFNIQKTNDYLYQGMQTK